MFLQITFLIFKRSRFLQFKRFCLQLRIFS